MTDHSYDAQECIHPFAALGIDGSGVMWCTVCLKKPLVIPPPTQDHYAGDGKMISDERLGELASMIKNFGHEFLLPHANARSDLYSALRELKALRERCYPGPQSEG